MKTKIVRFFLKNRKILIKTPVLLGVSTFLYLILDVFISGVHGFTPLRTAIFSFGVINGAVLFLSTFGILISEMKGRHSICTDSGWQDFIIGDLCEGIIHQGPNSGSKVQGRLYSYKFSRISAVLVDDRGSKYKVSAWTLKKVDKR